LDNLIWITSTYSFSVVMKVFLGVILCGIIGLERQNWNKPAGFKTHVLLGLCGVLIMLSGEFIANKYIGITSFDPTRLPAQLLSGIGFIGAGTILRNGFSVKGLTTAVSLLSVTCIGLAVGMGFYLGAILMTVIVYLVLSSSHVIIENIAPYSNVHLTIKAEETNDEMINRIQSMLVEKRIKIKSIRIREEKDNEGSIVKIVGKCRSERNINTAVADLSSLEQIEEVVHERED